MSSGDGLCSIMPETMTLHCTVENVLKGKSHITTIKYNLKKGEREGREGGRKGKGKEGKGRKKGLQERHLRFMREKLVCCRWGKNKWLSPAVRQRQREG